MNKLWIFGDSYSTYNREREAEGVSLSIYTELANHLNLIQSNKSISGLGNIDIYNNLLRFLPEYKSGDIIIFQLSFLDRFSYIDQLKNRELNAHESELYSYGKTLFLHPQYYHNSNREISDSQIKAFNDFIQSNQSNLIDIYFKFFIQLRFIINFLEKNGITFKLLILDDRNMDYNGSSISLYTLLEEIELIDNIIKIEDRFSIRTSRFYIEDETYKFHHFTLNTIQKYADALKENFK